MLTRSAALLFVAATLLAQTSETVFFRAVLSPGNEVPPVTGLNAGGSGTVVAHLVRDASGQVVSGSVDFNVNYSFPGAVNITGMHIHRGTATESGPVTIGSGVSGSAPVQDPTGQGLIARQAQVPPSDTEGLQTLRGMLQDPSRYYLNLHTSDYPAGVIRGQLERAEMAVLMAELSPASEVPPIQGLNASGVGSVLALRTTSASGRVTSGQVIFNVNYAFPEQVTFTGMHIHAGPAGVNAPVTISSGIGAGGVNVASESGGSGFLMRTAEVPVDNAPALSTLNGLFSNPGNFYLNLHTTENPGGAIRAQLRRTDMIRFPVTLLPSNEVPAVTGLDAQGIGEFRAHTLRAPDGSVKAGVVIFDVNHRFPSSADFTGLHIHNGTVTESGPVTIDSGVRGAEPIASETGFGNIYRMVNVTSPVALAAVQSLVRNPENHYINLHTRVNPAGAVRAQLAAASTAPPALSAVISAISDPARATVAPGGLMTVFGSDLTKVPGNLAGFADGTLPGELNGTSVTVAGRAAPLFVVAPGYLVAQVPVDTPAGQQPVVVRNANGAGQPATASVAATAPAIFYDAAGGIVVNNSTFQLIRPGNPARAGDVLLIYSTGLGQTTPRLETGRIVQFPPQSDTAPVTVTIGGQNAEVIYSIASPGFVGLYQTAVRLPAGVAPGSQPLALRIGEATSNTVNVAVQ